jgi:flagellar FliL protein
MSNKMLIILVMILFVVMVGLSAGLFMIWNKLSTGGEQVGAVSDNETKVQPKNDAPGVIYPLETFIVNLADEDGKRYLRLTLDLELKKGILEESIKQRLPQIRDSILMVLPSKHFEDIRTTEGKNILKNEIIARVNTVLGRESISNIFFSEFVVQ